MVTTPNAVIDRMDINGFLVIKAPNVTVTRSIVRGGVADASYALVMVTDAAATNFTIADSELTPAHPSVYLDGIRGDGFTARRLDIHGTVDGIRVIGGNVRIESSWLHDNRTYNADPYQGGGPTHNDGIQVMGGSNIRIAGNTISGAGNAALMVAQNISPVSDLQFTGNWVDGGACSVNLVHNPRASLNGITVSDNKFGRNTRNPGCAIVATYEVQLTAERNVWKDDGTAVKVRRG